MKEFIDNEGRKIQWNSSKGITVITLVEPSQNYIDNVLKPLQLETEQIKLKEEQETLIQTKLRELIEKGIIDDIEARIALLESKIK